MCITKLHKVTNTVFCNIGISFYNKELNGSYNEFEVHVTVHCDKFRIIKPTRCNSFSNLFLE